MNIFEANAAELERLRERVLETVRRRSESSRQRASWEEACRAFFAAYDKLAFPGGLNREIELLRAGDPDAIEMAVRFIEANPWYFRSGYHKADVLKLLKKLPLSDDQCARLRQAILERVRGRPLREMRAYGRLALKISSPEFEMELANIAKNANRQAARHAQLILGYLAQAKTSKSP
jgi:hypothetical protein